MKYVVTEQKLLETPNGRIYQIALRSDPFVGPGSEACPPFEEISIVRSVEEGASLDEGAIMELNPVLSCPI
jgi:hypothetical protein